MYGSSYDRDNRINQIGETKITNSVGKVVYENIESKEYYIFAHKNGCLKGDGFVEKIKKDTTTEFYVTLDAFGTIVLANTSSDKYEFKISGEMQASYLLNGKESKVLEYVKIGTYKFDCKQKDGYLLWPTENSYTKFVGECDTIAIGCNGNWNEKDMLGAALLMLL